MEEQKIKGKEGSKEQFQENPCYLTKYLKIMKEKSTLPRNLHPGNLFFRSEGEVKTSPNKT
jgi:hypothetical protein